MCSTQCAARPAAPSTSPGVAELKQEHEDLTAECKSAESNAQQAAVAADSAAASRADCDAAKKCTDDEVAQLEKNAQTADMRKTEMEQAAARCRSRLGQLANDTKFITENAVANENLKNVVEEVKTADDFIARCEEADNPQVCPPSKLEFLRKKKDDLLAKQMNAEIQKKALEKKYPALNAVSHLCCWVLTEWDPTDLHFVLCLLPSLSICGPLCVLSVCCDAGSNG